MFDKTAEDLIVERHEANGEMFGAFFDKPEFRKVLLDYLATSYDEIRDEDAG